MVQEEGVFPEIVRSAVMTPALPAACWLLTPMATYTHTDYGSMFAADAYRAIIWEIQTIWLALKVTGHFVGAVFSASNNINYFFSGVFSQTD